ncbi:MAG: hypothetical protein HN348_17075, partial [Proteobacteria bacterium]|nr:hypothetical protein [Pseudomonadota bacterium]
MRFAWWALIFTWAPTVGCQPPDSDSTPNGDTDTDVPCVDESDELSVDVHSFLTGLAPGFLSTYDETYGDICFDTVAAAIRTWPVADLHQEQPVVETTYEVPLTDESAPLFVFVGEDLLVDGSERLPLLVWLHGANGSGYSQIHNPNIQNFGRTAGMIVAAPTATDCDWSALDECSAQVLGVIRDVKRRFPIDDNRVFLSGHSMGGRGSFTLALTYPHLLAAAVPSAGSIGAFYDTTDIEVHLPYVRPHIENGLHTP